VTPVHADRLCLGWQWAMPYPEPGPPPRRPTPSDPERLAADWAASQRREERLLNRPLRAALMAVVAIAVVAVVLAALVAGLVVVCCVLIGGVSGYAIWQGERALRSRLADERGRVGKLRATQESRLFARQAEHASQVRQWQALRAAYLHQKHWYAVCAPSGIRRADVAGGTRAGWSALLTTAGAHRLAAGGRVTVLDLSGGSVALDLIAFARASGVEPLVLRLPGDPIRLNPVGAGSAGPPPPRSPLRVLVLDQHAEVHDRAFDNYLAVMLAQLPGNARRGSPWQHTLLVFGADRLRGDVIDRLCDACDAAGTGLVLAYHALPAHVRQRLGRGGAVLAFMRPASAEDAKEISEQLGTEHHLVIGRLTETAGLLVTDGAPGVTGGAAPGVTGGAAPGVASGAAALGVTAWGKATAAAAAADDEAQDPQPAREFTVGQHELQRLPASAMIVGYPSPVGRQVVMVDANPGIGGLGSATMLTLQEFLARPASVPAPAAAAEAPTAPQAGKRRAVPLSWRAGGNRPPPNLGPPPSRLDWRKRPGA
jgi:hypothetical protein